MGEAGAIGPVYSPNLPFSRSGGTIRPIARLPKDILGGCGQH